MAYLVLIITIIIMTGFAVKAFLLIRQGRLSDPFVETVTDMMPVAGLVATLISAGAIRLMGRRDLSLEHLLVSVLASLVAWMAYMVLNVYKAARTKEALPDETMQKTRGRVESVHKAVEDLNKGVRELNRQLELVDGRLAGIEARVDEKEGLGRFFQSVPMVARDFGILAAQMETLIPTVEKLRDLSGSEFRIVVRDNTDLPKLTRRIQDLGDYLERINHLGTRYDYEFRLKSEPDNLDEIMKTVAEAVKGLNEADLVFDLMVRLPEDLAPINDQLTLLLDNLTRLKQGKLEHRLDITANSDLAEISLQVERIGKVLAKLGETGRTFHMDFSVPPDAEDRIARLEAIRRSIQSMAGLPERVAFSFLLDEDTIESERTLYTLEQRLKNISGMERDIGFKIGLALNPKLQEQIENVKNFAETLQEIGEVARELRESRNLDPAVVEIITELRRLFKDALELTRFKVLGW